MSWTPLLLVALLSQQFQFKVTDTFPTQIDMDNHQFSLDLPVDIGVCGNKLLVLDQFEHCVHIFSTSGDYLGGISRMGSGPGELTYPSMLLTIEGGFWVYDEQRRFQRFDQKGSFQSQFKVLDPIFAGIALTDGLFTSIISPRTPKNFAMYSAKGKPQDRYAHPLRSRYNHLIMDNRVTMTKYGNTIAALQMYDSMLLLFDDKGRLQSKRRLAGNPLDWEPYQELDYVFSFVGLVMTKQWLLAFYSGQGEIGVNQYTHDGDWVNRHRIPFPGQEIFSIVKAVALDDSPTPDLILLLNRPLPQLTRITWTQLTGSN